MAQHGYLHDWDEGWEHDEDRERGWRDPRDRDWRGASERNRHFMFGEREHGRSERERAPRGFSAHPDDDHYRSWRDKQMQALDREYKDYCREREQQFHREFDDWRRKRRDQFTSGKHDSQEELIVGAAKRLEPMPDPAEPATLGVAEPEISPPARTRRS